MSAASRPGAEIVAADLLEGDPVFDRGGEALGVIADVMIDVERGSVAYAIVATTACAGLDERLLAVPWTALRVASEREGYVLQVDRPRLAQAPAFDRDPVSSMGDERWAREVHAFYGVEPYWRRALLGSRSPGAFDL